MPGKLIISLIGFLLSSLCRAQVITPTETQQERKGIHYLFPEFRPAKIIRKDGNSSEGNLNYNLLTEEIIIDLGTTKVAYSPMDPGTRFFFGETELRPVDGVIYQVLENGPISLLVHRKQTMERTGQQTGLGRTSGTYANNANTYSSEPEVLPTLKDKEILYSLVLPGNFGLKDVNAYFIQENTQLTPLRRLKQFESIFSNNPGVKDFIKKEKIKFDREEDLIKVMKFVNGDR